MKHFLALPILITLTYPLQAQDVTIETAKDVITFKIGKSLITQYHIAPAGAKPYFYPLYAPGDVPITRGWPMEKGQPKETTDHVHQKSAWFAHGDIVPEGIELKTKAFDKTVKGVDFWSEMPGYGKVTCIAVGKPTAGKHSASIATQDEWKTPDGSKIMDEKRTISLYDLGDARLLVLDIDLLASVCPLTFGDMKEGAMAVRINDEITVKNGGNFVTAEGKKNEKEVWGRKSDWCDYYGKIGSHISGVAIFDDPQNTCRSCWHARNYGLMAANPFGRHASLFPDQKENKEIVKLAKGNHLQFRYGILLHAGDPKEGKVAEYFKTFCQLHPK